MECYQAKITLLLLYTIIVLSLLSHLVMSSCEGVATGVATTTNIITTTTTTTTTTTVINTANSATITTATTVIFY